MIFWYYAAVVSLPPADLTNIYFGAFSFYSGILLWGVELRDTHYLSDEPERVQKRTMRIIFPSHSYDETLQLANCTRLSNRRHKTCINTLQKIVNSLATGPVKTSPILEYYYQVFCRFHIFGSVCAIQGVSKKVRQFWNCSQFHNSVNEM
jgi:hypothetical protein